MLLDDIKKIKSSNKDLRSFGITLGIAFALLALFFLWRGKAHVLVWSGAAAFFLFSGLLAPQFLKPVQKAWMTLALLMGWVMTRVILTVIFFLVLTPLALLARLSGKRFLNASFRENVESYWLIRKVQSDSKENYEKQFQ